jgi:hypothetical protein
MRPIQEREPSGHLAKAITKPAMASTRSQQYCQVQWPPEGFSTGRHEGAATWFANSWQTPGLVIPPAPTSFLVSQKNGSLTLVTSKYGQPQENFLRRDVANAEQQAGEGSGAGSGLLHSAKLPVKVPLIRTKNITGTT